MGILDELKEKQVWLDFLADRTQKQRLNKTEAGFFEAFIDSGAFLAAAEGITRLSIPQKRLINKEGASKKRAVYCYTPEENAVLKVMAFLLYRYDAAFPDNLYSFRRERFAKTAIRRLVSEPGICEKYAYKLDIRDYFNSVDTALLLNALKTLLADDPPLYKFFDAMLTAQTATFEGGLIHEARGVMAGTPTSAFLANVYLTPLDGEFLRRGALYARYSDDIIVFAQSEAQLDEYKRLITDTLARFRLCVNPSKEAVTPPHGCWEFLGVSYCDGVTDISQNTKRKLKGRLRRKARALYRWKLKKQASNEQAMRAFIRAVNRKLYTPEDSRLFSWTRWFFPLLTTDAGLKELDEYIMQYMRYVAFGRFSRANYRVSYAELKACGYVPLVAEYYKHLRKARE